MSNVEQGTSLTKGFGMRAGHSTSPGTRKAPFPQRPLAASQNCRWTSARARLRCHCSNTGACLSAAFSSRSAARSLPTLRSMPVSSP